jgi:hyperosmotically inducible protein
MQSSHRICLRLTVLLMLSASVFAQQAATGSRFDAQIQQDVEKLLRGKSQYRGVTATTEDQIVTVTGNVNLYIDKMNLERKIEKMKNVEAVRNHVQVQSNVPDNQLGQTLADKLRYDRVGFGIAFNAITLSVENGVATLGGNVHDYPSRDSAIAIAETTPGVKDVIDNIEVAPTSGFDDDLRLRLYRAIYGDPVLQKYAIDPQKPIRIVVDNGHVALYGVVNNQGDKNIAGIRANQVSGVFSVDNQLIALDQIKK